MFEIKDWTLKVHGQRKSKSGMYFILSCVKQGKKKEDGNYEKGMWINVFVNDDTDWDHMDLTGRWVDVSGSFNHGVYTKDEKEELTFSIFANRVKEHIWDAKQEAEPATEAPVKREW